MKFLQGPLVKGPSGSLGGTVFSHNRFGYYCRDKVIPINPNTALQQKYRNIFQNLVWVWGNVLTSAMRTAWNLYASSVVMKDKLGEDIYLTGLNHFVRSNSVIVGVPLTRVDAGPTNFTLADTDPTIVATLSEATQQISLTFDDAMLWVDEDNAAMQVSMSIPQSVGKSYYLPRFRIAGYMEGDSATPVTSPQTFTAPFVVTEDQGVLIRCRIVRADARLSPPFRATSVVAS